MLRSTSIGNYTDSLRDAQDATDIRPLLIKAIISGNLGSLKPYRDIQYVITHKESSHYQLVQLIIITIINIIKITIIIIMTMIMIMIMINTNSFSFGMNKFCLFKL